MSNITLHATGVHKQKEDYGCFGIAFSKQKSKKVNEFVGQFPSNSKIETQLSTLLYGILMIADSGPVDSIHVVTDFTMVQNFMDGTVEAWASNDWKKENDKEVKYAAIWDEVLDAVRSFNVTFEHVEIDDPKINNIYKLMKTEARRPKNPKPLFQTEEVEEVKEEVVKSVEKAATDRKEPKTKAKEPEYINDSFFDDIDDEFVICDDGFFRSTDEVEEGNVIRIDRDLKGQCELLFEEIGVDVETAVTMFLKHSLRKRGLTLDLVLGDE